MMPHGVGDFDDAKTLHPVTLGELAFHTNCAAPIEKEN